MSQKDKTKYLALAVVSKRQSRSSLTKNTANQVTAHERSVAEQFFASAPCSKPLTPLQKRMQSAGH